MASLSIHIANVNMKIHAESKISNGVVLRSPPIVTEASSATDTTTELRTTLLFIVIGLQTSLVIEAERCPPSCMA